MKNLGQLDQQVEGGRGREREGGMETEGGRERQKEKMGHSGRGSCGTSLGEPLQSFFGHSHSAPQPTLVGIRISTKHLT